MPRPGTYALFFRMSRLTEMEVGSLHGCVFPAGDYAYAGSALGGLDARLARHLRADKRRHWHIDHVLAFARVTAIIEFEGTERIECQLSDRLLAWDDPTHDWAGFGSSDCRCRSHLHYFGRGRGEVPALAAGALGGRLITPCAAP